MKIVNRKTFLALPSGTMYAEYEPHIFGEIQIKADTCGNDFVCIPLIPQFEGWHDSEHYFEVVDAMVAGGTSPPLDYDSYGRDGMFNNEQLFAVFDRVDVEALVKHITEMCLT